MRRQCKIHSNGLNKDAKNIKPRIKNIYQKYIHFINYPSVGCYHCVLNTYGPSLLPDRVP
jgi:hypothetical protein